MAEVIKEVDLNFWIANSYNVCFRGAHGVGKTATILEAFKKNNLRYLYFSGATIDPMTELVGVPKEYLDTSTGNKYLDYVRPKYFAEDTIDAIFIDEFNRANTRTRNSLMELLQFKSINGKKLNNLKIVWTAINPANDEENDYDVEDLDPAQLDRFHIIVDIPYTPSASYFRDKYGKEMGDVAIGWWKDLDKKAKNAVSPRRLDYALDVYSKKGDIRYVLPKEVNVSRLIQELSFGSYVKKLEEVLKNKDIVEGKKFINNENNYSATIDNILKKTEYKNFYIPLLNDEKLSGLMHKDNSVKNFVFNQVDKFKDLVETISKSKSALAYDASMAYKKYEKLTNPVAVSKPTKSAPINNANISINYRNKVATVNSVNYNIYFNDFTTSRETSMVTGYLTGWKMLSINDKVNLYKQLDYIPKDLTLSECLTIGIKIVRILQSSQVDTVKTKMPYLVEMFNHLNSYALLNFKCSTAALSVKEVSYLQNKFTGILL